MEFELVAIIRANYEKDKEELIAELNKLKNPVLIIGEMLNTNQVKPHLSKYWCIPKENDPSFIANMEDVLGIYKRVYNPDIPVICMDEKPVQLLGEIRERISAKPLRMDEDTGLPKLGKSEKIDSEYIRCGTASIFMFTEPLNGWHHVTALKSWKKGDFALMMREISEKYYRDTPKHGSWLNIAETELSSLSMQCLGNQRIDSIEVLNEMLGAWEIDRNKQQKGVNWQFTAEDARIKLKRLYPTPLFN